MNWPPQCALCKYQFLYSVAIFFYGLFHIPEFWNALFNACGTTKNSLFFIFGVSAKQSFISCPKLDFRNCYLIIHFSEIFQYEKSKKAFIWSNLVHNYQLLLGSEKAGRFEKLLGFARSHFIVTRGSVSLSCATTPHPSCFSKS